LKAGDVPLTPEQRAAIKRRDNQECQMDCSRARYCGGRGNRPNVHHILPQAYARMFGICPDFPENVITVCETFHQREIHTHGISETQKAIRERRPYWDTTHDRLLYATALRNTQRALKRGWHFPHAGE